jgi:hypothetical protein
MIARFLAGFGAALTCRLFGMCRPGGTLVLNLSFYGTQSDSGANREMVSHFTDVPDFFLFNLKSYFTPQN